MNFVFCVFFLVFDHTSHGDDFSYLFGHSKDVSDYEWTCWMPFIFKRLLPWITAHVLVTEFVRWNYLKVESHSLIYFIFNTFIFHLYRMSHKEMEIISDMFCM